MIVKETEYKSAGRYAFYAAKDASMNHAINASRFTAVQKLKAERIKLALEMVYNCEEVLLHNNKTFIRVKVVNGTVKDKKMLLILEAEWALDGVEKVTTKTKAIIYRVK